jgi:hypothetical protein
MMIRIAAVAVIAVLSSSCAERAGPSSAPEPSRESQVYAAIVRQLVTEDHTFGGGDPGFRVIYVLDRATPRAADGIAPEADEGTPIAPGVQREIRAALSDLPPIRFVPRRQEVVGPMEDGGVVKDHGALVTLGTIPPGENRVEVGASLYIANLAGTWLTYVVELGGDGWAVTGTTGPIAIS